MKRTIMASILLLVTIQVFAIPNIIGRWQSAPIWNRFEKMILEINFKDTAHFETKVVVDNTDFCDGTMKMQSMGGTYQLQDSLCLLTADTSTYTTSSTSLWYDQLRANEVDSFIILQSNNSEDVMALIDHLNREVFILYRQN